MLFSFVFGSTFLINFQRENGIPIAAEAEKKYSDSSEINPLRSADVRASGNKQFGVNGANVFAFFFFLFSFVLPFVSLYIMQMETIILCTI